MCVTVRFRAGVGVLSCADKVYMPAPGFCQEGSSQFLKSVSSSPIVSHFATFVVQALGTHSRTYRLRSTCYEFGRAC